MRIQRSLAAAGTVVQSTLPWLASPVHGQWRPMKTQADWTLRWSLRVRPHWLGAARLPRWHRIRAA